MGKLHRPIERLGITAIFLLCHTKAVKAANGHWEITQLPYQNVSHPAINNNGEIVWAGGSGGITSSVRGQLTTSGVTPHIANSGEVVYADWFGGPHWDLVSITRGRLTQAGAIEVNVSDFDVNSNGEVVYVINDTNGYAQVFSTIRGQVTFDETFHGFPCINDSGEIVWSQYIQGVGTMAISSTRGTLGLCPLILDLNNSGDYCFQSDFGNSSPHIFSNVHGVIVSDSNQNQWGGSINDNGTIVWMGPSGIYPTGGMYMASWVVNPTLFIVPESATFALEWHTNATGFHVEYTTNLNSTADWHALVGVLTTNGANFRLTTAQNLGNAAYFRLSN